MMVDPLTVTPISSIELGSGDLDDVVGCTADSGGQRTKTDGGGLANNDPAGWSSGRQCVL